MAFSTATEGDVQSEINITPLVDVMLVLLIVFMVTAPLLTNAIKVNLPKTAVTAPPEPHKAVNLSVDAHGQVFLDKTPVAATDIEPRLKALNTASPDLSLHLHADEAVSYGTVAQVMASIERAGITKLSVLTTGR
jgi:biopolymer transport protein ExbD